MKLALRILNFVIMAISLAATIFLFAYPTFSFNSNIGLDVVAFSKFVPETEYSNNIDIVNSLGTDQIELRLKFKVYDDIYIVNLFFDGNMFLAIID